MNSIPCIKTAHILLFGTVLTMIMPAFCLAQGEPCDLSVDPIFGEFGYKKRDSRCEGLFESRVGAKKLELLSMTKGVVEFNLARDKYLYVMAPDIYKDVGSSINIRSVSIPAKTYYRMDAVLAVNAFMKWPLSDILYPLQLTADRIGVFGWIGTKENKTFVPLVVVTEKKKAASTLDAPIHLILRAPTDIERVIWRRFKKPKTFEEPSAYTDSGVSPRRAWKPIVVTIPTIETAIEVKAKPRGRDRWLTLRLRIAKPKL